MQLGQEESPTFLFIFISGALSDLSRPGIRAGARALTPITPGGLWPAATKAALPVIYLFSSPISLNCLLRLQTMHQPDICYTQHMCRGQHIGNKNGICAVLQQRGSVRTTLLMQLVAWPQQRLTLTERSNDPFGCETIRLAMRISKDIAQCMSFAAVENAL